ncbi:MAG: type I methionyl aminopeptidase [Clostridiales bacterium]|nr:type I methionyl aminopeptidase [Clostridiales bacterium]
MINIKTSDEIARMREAGRLLHGVLAALRDMVRPGMTTAELDREAERMIRSAGAAPSFKGYEGYQYTLCTSVDDQVVHGFPTDEPLREGQLLSVDAGLVLNGWQADSAFTSPVGQVSPEVAKLIRVTEECFWLAAEQARAGNRLGDIGWAVQKHAEANGFGVIRDMCGHGIGRDMHEEPNVPNYGTPGRGVRLREGMTLAIEPMIALGDWPVYIDQNGWAVITRDHSPCAHYEHTVAITRDGPEILTLPGAKVRRPA